MGSQTRKNIDFENLQLWFTLVLLVVWLAALWLYSQTLPPRLMNNLHFAHKSKLENIFFFKHPSIPGVLETIQPPLHQAYHSGPTHNLNRFLLPISFRPRPEDPKSTLIHFQHGGSGNWMPLFKRFKLFLKVFFCWQRTFILFVTGCLTFRIPMLW